MRLEDLKTKLGKFVLVKLFTKEYKKEGNYYTFQKCYTKVDNESIFFDLSLVDKESRYLFTQTLNGSKQWLLNLENPQEIEIVENEKYKSFRIRILSKKCIEVVKNDN